MKHASSFGLSHMLLGWLHAVLAALVLIGAGEATHQRSAAALQGMQQSFATRACIARLLTLMVDAETGSHGYLLTGAVRDLEPHDRAVAAMGQALQELRATLGQDAADAALLARTESLVQRRLEELALSVRLRREGRDAGRTFAPGTDPGKQHMDAIRALAAQLDQRAQARLAASEAQVRTALVLGRLAVGGVALAVLAAFWLSLRQVGALAQAGARQQQALERERDRLELTVRERTASLERLATHLQQVREDERAHLARELHDELGALLTAAKLDVARLNSQLAARHPDAAQRLQHLAETLNRGIALKRRIIEDLRPSTLSNLGLTASLEILAREFSERSGIPVETELETVELDDGRQLTVYRLVQESLTNVAKYAQAARARIAVRTSSGGVEVEVRDDGCGFDPAQVRPVTHGLAGMRHRVQAAGGRLQVDSAPGRGTRVHALLPRPEPHPG